MNENQFPPRRTRCVDCGCCLATVYAGNDPLCWECDTGEICKIKALGQRRRPAGIPAPDPTSIIAKVDRIEGTASLKVAKVLAQTPAPKPSEPLPDLRSQFDRDEPEASDEVEKQEEPQVQEEAPMPKTTGGGLGHRIPDEVRAQIQAEPDNLTNEAIGRKYGISGVSVGNIRNEKPKPAQVIEISAPIPTPGKVMISAELTEEGAECYWRNLSLEQKGAMIELQLREILRRATA